MSAMLHLVNSPSPIFVSNIKNRIRTMIQKSTLYQWTLLMLITFLLPACIGEDVKEDSVQSIEVSASKTALLLNETTNLTATLKNTFGDTFAREVSWVSSATSVATIDASGTVTAAGTGQTKITAIQEGVTSNELLITVVDNANTIATVTVTAAASNVAVGNTLQLAATAQNISGSDITASSYTWASNNTAIATVDQNGLVTGISNGEVSVTATADGVNSQAFTLTIGAGSSLTGQFQGIGGHAVSGSATLKTTQDGVQLVFSENFSTVNGPGLYLYLTNTSNSPSGGKEVAKLSKTSGSDTYSVSGVSIDQYKYVLIYCKPFSTPFSVAEFK